MFLFMVMSVKNVTFRVILADCVTLVDRVTWEIV
jgi:hypothetical protein